MALTARWQHLGWTAVLAASASASIANAGPRCDPPLPARIERAPLSQVLRGLARTQAFELQYRTDEDPLVAVGAVRDPVDLMTTLAQRANLVVHYAAQRGCAHPWRIVSVWVLPTGVAVPQLPAAVRPAAPHVPSAGEIAYLRGHGIGPAASAADAAASGPVDGSPVPPP